MILSIYNLSKKTSQVIDGVNAKLLYKHHKRTYALAHVRSPVTTNMKGTIPNVRVNVANIIIVLIGLYIDPLHLH